MTVDMDTAAPEAGESNGDAEDSDVATGKRVRQEIARGWALAVGLTAAMSIGALSIWFGYEWRQAAAAHQRDEAFIQAARQTALNLTTIDFAEVNTDVQRVIDGAMAPFRDDFKQRSQPFMELVRKAQSISKGTVAEAGLESRDGDHAQVLVAVNVTMKAANGAQDGKPRSWRMRVELQSTNDGIKASNVEFVP